MHPASAGPAHRREKWEEMIQTVRAAGFAAAAMFIAASAAWGGPLQAWQGDAAPVTTHYLDHAFVGTQISEIGLNDVEATGSAAAATAASGQHVAALAEHLLALADAAMPQPRTLGELVDTYAEPLTDNQEQDCLANAVYFEARGEPIEGQLAVAEVVLNRTLSGRYPSTICGVVTQPWQFSFVRDRIIPRADRGSESWHRAVAIARIAEAGASRLLPRNVLWYHADYVDPDWGRRLDRSTKIGLHIFYS
jgi:spore germination cell wall hydrolase CwlJ-like protein